jgi:hypothetical protein
MRHAARLIALGIAALALHGCLAKTALDTAVGVASLPVKVASAGVDAATTSQSEADQNRGREIRRREERLGRLQRDYERQIHKCGDGDRAACDKARLTYAEMQVLLPSIPVEGEQGTAPGS